MNNIIKLLDKNLEYIEHELIEDTIYISVKSIKEYICCPHCCTPSNKVYSGYKRLFQDLPIQGLKVIIIIYGGCSFETLRKKVINLKILR